MSVQMHVLNGYQTKILQFVEAHHWGPNAKDF